MSSLLVVGKTGQLAVALQEVCSRDEIDASFLSRFDLDLSDTHDVITNTLMTQPTPDAVILAAAYTHVEKAETDCEIAYYVNLRGTETIAQYCEQHNIPLIYVSTDYIYDGRKASPYVENDAPNPLNFYGETKRLAEECVLSLRSPHVVIRTSWVFDGVSKNFFTTMLRLAQTQSQLSIVADQIGRPTYAGHLADACLKFVMALKNSQNNASGLFHITGQGGAVSWAEFAHEIFQSASLTTKIKPISTADYATKTERPLNSVLSNARYNTLFNEPLPSWKRGLEEALSARHNVLGFNG